MPRPADRDIVALARREANPVSYKDFEPIVRGPLFAVLALGVLGFLSLPWLIIGIIRDMVGKPWSGR